MELGIHGLLAKVWVPVLSALVAFGVAMLTVNSAADLNDNQYVERITRLEGERENLTGDVELLRGQLAVLSSELEGLKSEEPVSPRINKISEELAAMRDQLGSLPSVQPIGTDVDEVVNRIIKLHGSDFMGPQGIAGLTGDRGPIGAIGPRGEAGPQGLEGTAPSLAEIVAALNDRNVVPGGQAGGSGGNIGPDPEVLVRAGTCFDVSNNNPVIGVVFENGALICNGQAALFTLREGTSEFINAHRVGDSGYFNVRIGGSIPISNDGTQFFLNSIDSEAGTFTGGISPG